MATKLKTLHLVLDLRQKEEDTARQIYQDAVRQVTLFREQIKRLQDYRVEYVQELETQGRSGFSAATYISYQGFLKKLDDIILRQLQQLAMLEIDAQYRQRIYLERQKRRKVIEKLIEKQLQERLRAENRAEQKALDDFVVTQSYRRMTGQG